MRNFVITIPVQGNFQFFLRQLGYELITSNGEITEAILSGELPDLRMGDECDEYPYSLELTADKPDSWVEPEFDLQNHIQELGSRIPPDDVLVVSSFAIPQLEVMG